MMELVEQSWFWWSGAVPNKPLGLGCEAWILSIVLVKKGQKKCELEA